MMVYNFNTCSATGLAKRAIDYMQQKSLFFIVHLLTVNVPSLTLIFIIELGRSEQRRQCVLPTSFPFDVSYSQNQ